MNLRPLILFLLLPLFVAVSANRAWACGNHASAKCGRENAEQSSCTADNEGKKAGHCSDKKSGCGQKCPNSRDCRGHNCPCSPAASGHAGGLPAELPPALPALLVPGDALLRQAFYFAQHMPEAVYLPVWQPPKLGV